MADYDKLKEIENKLIQEIIDNDDTPIIKAQKMKAVKEVFTNHRTFMMKKEKVKKKVK